MRYRLDFMRPRRAIHVLGSNAEIPRFAHAASARRVADHDIDVAVRQFRRRRQDVKKKNEGRRPPRRSMGMKLILIPTTFAGVVGSSLLVLALAACGQAAASGQDGTPDASTPDGRPTTCEAACGADDGCCPAGCTAAADHDCRAPGPSRLVVLDHDGSIHVWNDTATLKDRAADMTIEPGASERLSLASYQDRLIVASKDASNPLALYDDYWTKAGAAAPADRIPASAMNGMSPDHNWGTELRVGPGANLWVSTGGGVWLLKNGASAGSTVSPAAYFTHEWSQLPSFAYDAEGKRLLAGQISGAGVVAWNQPLDRPAGTYMPDWTLDKGTAAWSMQVAAGRLYTAGSKVSIWNGLPTLHGPAAPNVTLGESSGIPDSYIPYMTVNRNVLLVSVDDVGSLSSVRKVNLYRDAGSVNGDRAPDQFVIDADMRGPQKTYLDAAGTLYILDGDAQWMSKGEGAIYIYDHALDAPVLRARITTGLSWPRDFVVVE
jgi:hypothetical protein